MKVTTKKIKSFLAPLDLAETVGDTCLIHPSGLVVPSAAADGRDDSLLGGVCPVAVLDEDTFADALTMLMEDTVPASLRALVDAAADAGAIPAHMTHAFDLLIDSADIDEMQEEMDDEVMAALLTMSGEDGDVLDYLDEDGVWLVVRPSDQLVKVLIRLAGKKHSNWLKPGTKVESLMTRSHLRLVKAG